MTFISRHTNHGVMTNMAIDHVRPKPKAAFDALNNFVQLSCGLPVGRVIFRAEPDQIEHLIWR